MRRGNIQIIVDILCKWPSIVTLGNIFQDEREGSRLMFRCCILVEHIINSILGDKGIIASVSKLIFGDG